MSGQIGARAVAIARAAIESEVSGKPFPHLPDDGRFGESSGAFVTLKTYPGGDLRGCIGYPMPVFPLARAVELSARSACHDPRFPDLRPSELGSVTVEVTVLTVPEPVTASCPDDLARSVGVGRDGLMLELGPYRGLLLPQVPAEQGWDAVEYLEGLSVKAGLPRDAWKHPDARICRFEGEIYHESEPRGSVERGE